MTPKQRARERRRDRQRYEELQRLLAQGLSQDEAIVKVRKKFPFPYDRLVSKLKAHGFTDDQISEGLLEFGRQRAREILEERAEFLRRRNKRSGASHRRAYTTRLAKGLKRYQGRFTPGS